MTHLHPGGETRPARSLLSPAPHTHQHAPLGIDGFRIRDAIAARRARIAALESEWVSTCEREAARNLPRGVRLDDRTTWDKAMWTRYLTAAAGCEPDYLPRLRQLHEEIDRLERLLAPLSATTRRAA